MTGLAGWDFAQVFEDEDAVLAEAARLPRVCGDLAERAPSVFDGGDAAAVERLVAELGELDERATTLNNFARMRQYADAVGPGVQRVASAGQAAAASARAELSRVLDAWCALPDAGANELLGDEGLAPAHHRLRRARELHRYRLAPEAERAWSAREESGRVRWASLQEQVEGAARVAFDDGSGEREWDLGALWGVTRRADVDVRRRAYAAVARIFGGVADVVAACWDAAIADRLAEDGLRGRSHPAQATLDEEELSLEGLESLLQAVWARLPARHDLLRRQQHLLGLERLLAADADGEPTGLPNVSLEETWETAVTGLRSLAPPLVDEAERLRAAQRVDLEDRPGKQPYAVTFSTGLELPAFLSVRWSGRASNVTTLGHELGHAMALGAMRRVQSPIARGWPGVVFEAPSLLGELAAGDALVAAGAPGHRPALRLVAAQDLSWSVFEATAFCRVELELYAERAAGRPLTVERILEAFGTHFGALFRPVCEFGEIDALVAMAGWASYAAGYRFYNFQYTVGALSALAIFARRDADRDRFEADLLRFLSFGQSVSPAEQLGVFGLELGSLALWEAGLNELEARFAAV